MARRQKTEIFSVFRQIEAVAAQILIDRGHATKIELQDIPEYAPKVNKEGEPVMFAVIVPGDRVAEFEKLIKDIRA